MSHQNPSWEKLNIIEVNFCDGDRKENTIIRNQIEAEKKRLLTKIPLKPFNTYHEIWVKFEGADPNLEISDKDRLISVKSGDKRGIFIQSLEFKDNRVEYDVLFNPKMITNYKKVNTEDSKAWVNFSIKGRAHPREPEVTLGKYRQEILLIRCDPEISIDMAIENGGRLNCLNDTNGCCPLAKATVKTTANCGFCYPVDLMLACKMEGQDQSPKILFGKPEDINFRTADRIFKTENHCYHYKDRNGHEFKIPNQHQEPSNFLEIRKLMPENEMIIPIHIDISSISGNCSDVLTLTIENTILYNLSKELKRTFTKPLRICQQLNVSSV